MVNWTKVKLFLERVTLKDSAAGSAAESNALATELWDYATKMEILHSRPVGHPGAFIAIGDAAEKAFTINSLTSLSDLMHEISVYLEKHDTSPHASPPEEFMQFLLQLEKIKINQPELAGPLYERIANFWREFSMSYEEFTRSAKTIGEQQVKLNQLTKQHENLISSLKRCNDENKRLTKQSEALMALMNRVKMGS